MKRDTSPGTLQEKSLPVQLLHSARGRRYLTMLGEVFERGSYGLECLRVTIITISILCEVSRHSLTNALCTIIPRLRLMKYSLQNLILFCHYRYKGGTNSNSVMIVTLMINWPQLLHDRSLLAIATLRIVQSSGTSCIHYTSLGSLA